ncbi:putative bifunctional diguanylate cyclase/phosphodiesterase [Novosphingobium sp. JCM 18896]|uniref:putative bifunctional diguanylate cyclase/phosphodiesterase n=1 Tax=Novosphingobium sp. JCM 18896 TaxID=2989731 RepID=UPI0022218FF2|nr:EAL domain-containing protein [Novosphingobium sp. JCM 18896]MCW1430012.1 EAL domain-containing protein [Novosphingobium sp. JCM 18896]
MPILRARALFSGLGVKSSIDQQVRKTLVASLYSNPLSLVIGAICGSVVCLAAALATGDFAMKVTAWCVAIIAVVRTIVLVAAKRFKRASAHSLELHFELGAFAYAGAVGALAALATAHNVLFEAQMVIVAFAVSYATAIAPRNAGRPVIALGQLLLVLAPLSVAQLTSDEPLIQLLGVATLLHIPSVISIALNVYRSLRNSIAAAETSSRLAEKMQVLARSDVVTGLLNRAGLNHHLLDRMPTLDPTRTFALFWMDLDRFKEVNDSLGHQTGDKLLAEVASRLKAAAPANATVARFGGDEFIVACETGDRNQTELLAKRMMEEIGRPIRIDGDRLEIAASMGIALYPEDGQDFDTLMQGADLALYRSKVNGRQQVTFFDPSMTRNLVRRREIESELRLALQRDELSIFFQPLIDLESGRIRSFEALVRWFHPEKGELRPDEFIPVAEETGAIITLGNWITAQAAKAAAQWPEDVTIAVNLSPLQIKAPGAAMAILSALREARLDPSRLELEITETVLLDHSQNTETFINELAEAGVRFALDDFGTGYSSLGYLNKYPFSKIKVDRSFISGINQGKKSDAIIRAVSGMGQTLGMEIVAEGLETIEQVRAVSEAGCTLGQGYYFSRPVPDYLAAMLLAKEREKTAAKIRKRA